MDTKNNQTTQEKNNLSTDAAAPNANQAQPSVNNLPAPNAPPPKEPAERQKIETEADANQPPAGNSVTPPPAPTEQPKPVEPLAEEKITDPKPKSQSSPIEPKQTIKPESQSQAPAPEKTNQAKEQQPQAPAPAKTEQIEKTTEKQPQIAEDLVKNKAALPIKEKPDEKIKQTQTENPASENGQTLREQPKPEIAPQSQNKPQTESLPKTDHALHRKPEPAIQDAKIFTPPIAKKPKIQPIVKPKQPAPAKQKNKISLTNYLKKLSEFRCFANAKRQKKMQANLDKIMEYAKKTQKVVNDDVERLTDVKHVQAVRYLNILKKQGKLIRFGKKSNIFYKPVKNT